MNNLGRHWKFLLAAGIATLFAFQNFAYSQEVAIVTVHSRGHGLTEAAAVKDAIVQAVGQVSGERINAQTTVQTQSRSTTATPTERSRTIDASIESLIRGVVKSSRTISVEPNAEAHNFTAVVDVGVATYRQSAQLNRIRIAVVSGVQPLPASLGQSASNFRDKLITGVSDTFVNSAKFAVLDRQQQSTAQKEYGLIFSGQVGIENYVRLQSKAVADFLIVVDVQNASISTSTLGRQRAKITAHAIVYDYTSSQVRQTVTTDQTRVFRDGAINQIAADVGTDLAQQIIDRTFPALVVGVDGEIAFINAGSGQFEAGERLRFFRRGTPIQDPYTKEAIGFSETLIGEGTVDEVLPKVSMVRIGALATDIASAPANSVVAHRIPDDGDSTEKPDPGFAENPNKQSTKRSDKW